MPDLEHLRGALSHAYRTPAFEGARERNQAAGISEISGFYRLELGPARRAIGTQAFSLRGKAQPRRHSGGARARTIHAAPIGGP